MNTNKYEDNEPLEFDFCLQWEWPSHIEDTLRRMLWISFVEACEMDDNEVHKHTELLRRQIASYPDSPAAVLDILSNLTEPSLLIRIAANPKTWPVTISRLAQHKSPLVRAAVAEHASLPIDAMKILAEDESVDVRYTMAENYALPSRYLRLLSLDENPYVACRATNTRARLSSRKTQTPHQTPLSFPKTRKAE